MSAAPISAPAPQIEETSVRAHPAADFNQVLDQQRALHSAAQRPQLGQMLFDQVDHIEKQHAALGQALKTGSATGPERMIMTAFNCAIETACLGRTSSLAGGAVKQLVQAQ
ncbi:MAG TPA: hypothetical protein VGX23_24140 [Actinocrinis sp.]|nr:hypothetical protein [Actinocrinis sp.]